MHHLAKVSLGCEVEGTDLIVPSLFIDFPGWEDSVYLTFSAVRFDRFTQNALDFATVLWPSFQLEEGELNRQPVCDVISSFLLFQKLRKIYIDLSWQEVESVCHAVGNMNIHFEGSEGTVQSEFTVAIKADDEDTAKLAGIFSDLPQLSALVAATATA